MVETQNLASLRAWKRAWRMEYGFVGWLLDSQRDGDAGLSAYGQQTIRTGERRKILRLYVAGNALGGWNADSLAGYLIRSVTVLLAFPSTVNRPPHRV